MYKKIGCINNAQRTALGEVAEPTLTVTLAYCC